MKTIMIERLSKTVNWLIENDVLLPGDGDHEVINHTKYHIGNVAAPQLYCKCCPQQQHTLDKHQRGHNPNFESIETSAV